MLLEEGACKEKMEPYLIEKDRAKFWKAYMDQIVDTGTVYESNEGVMREEMMEAFKHLMIEKAL